MRLLRQAIFLLVYLLLASQPILSWLKINPFLLYSLLLILVIASSTRSEVGLPVSSVDTPYYILASLLAVFSIAVNGFSGSSILLVFLVTILYFSRNIVNTLHDNKALSALFVKLSFAMLIFSALALFSHYILGLSPVPFVQDILNDRQYYFIPFSFSVSDGDLNITNFYRPSSIYDEPGAFAYAFVLLSIILILRGNRIRSALFLIVSVTIISGSFASLVVLLVYCLMFLVNRRRTIYKALPWVVIISVAFALLLRIPYFSLFLQSSFYDRIGNIQEVGLYEARGASIDESIQIFSSFDMLLSGAGRNIFNSGGDILSILVGYGLFPWLFYLVILARLFYFVASSLVSTSRSVVTDNIGTCSAVLAVLILQRPYIYHVYWAVPTMVSFMLINDAFLFSKSQAK
jgi:hypothetical protein